MRLLCAVLMTIFPAAAQQFTVAQMAHQPLTNDSIVTLAKAGFDELFILQLIRSSRTNFDTSVEGLVAMKKAGVSEDLIRLMAMPQASPPAAPAATATPAKVPPKKHGLFKRSSN
jgi:ABC-type enterochelin transport system permease subunit